jgi:hypothetical protein
MPNFYLTGGDYYKDGVPIGGGGGIAGTNYIYVAANGTDTDNAAELQAAYDQAKTLSPSSTNRITIICGPGYYNFGAAAFLMDTQYIDLVSLDGNRSIVFNSADPAGTISITANDVFVKGVDVQDKNFTIANNLNLIRIENCKGGENSFGGYYLIVSGTFINCIGGDISFGGFGLPSGTFINCIGGNYSFGGLSTTPGTFKDCQGGDYSFGGSGTASGTFTDCQSGAYSFGGLGTLTGKLYYCRLTSVTFETVSGGGVTLYCIDGNNEPNNQGFTPQNKV